MQYEFAKLCPALEPLQEDPMSPLSNQKDQVRVIGFDISGVYKLPWMSIDQVPSYYYPKNGLDKPLYWPLLSANERNETDKLENEGSTMYVPVRHVLRHVQDTSPAALNRVDTVRNTFFQRAPYGWLVLHHELKNPNQNLLGTGGAGSAR